MKKIILISVILTLISGYAFLSCKQQQTIPPEKTIANTLLLQIDSFTRICDELQAAVAGDSSAAHLQMLFLNSRIAFKKFEWAAEYFVPATARFVNGPPVQEIEMPEMQINEPAGLQIIEGILFPAYDTSKKRELTRQLHMLPQVCDKYNSYFRNIDIFDWQVFDAAKLEVYRIMTLGITGFDNPQTLKSSAESSAAMSSVSALMALYTNPDSPDDIVTKIDAATGYLDQHTDFNAFNRMLFITDYCNPVTAAISDLEKKRNIKVTRYNRLLNQDARTLFDTNTFNVNAYAPDRSSFVSDEKIALGKKLFADPVLSGNGKRSCQSCHQPEKAFTDGLVKNTVLGTNNLLSRNTPTLINAALQPSLFYDLRVNSLEDQSHTVVQSDNEMHGSMVVSVNHLWKDTVYRNMFLRAFPYEDQTKIDTFEIMNAIGSFIRSLVLLNSRFDEYMRGNKQAMSASEINGFNLFMGKAKCATCHYMPLFNGVFPPKYNRIEVEVIGVPKSMTKNEIDGDLGRYAIVPVESQKHAFKISTVRNTAATAPYMHNGVFQTLEQVMDFYNKGGGEGLGLHLENQTLPLGKLDLSNPEISDIIAFIKTLDSKMPLTQLAAK